MTRPCDALPPVRGSYTPDAPLKDLVWFRAGGPAEILFRPADAEDLATFLAAKPADLRVSVIGVRLEPADPTTAASRAPWCGCPVRWAR
ncbi:MAG: hypothetical protein WDN08_13845 [Rhizomicrobium sp.]